MRRLRNGVEDTVLLSVFVHSFGKEVAPKAPSVQTSIQVSQRTGVLRVTALSDHVESTAAIQAKKWYILKQWVQHQLHDIEGDDIWSVQPLQEGWTCNIRVKKDHIHKAMRHSADAIQVDPRRS